MTKRNTLREWFESIKKTQDFEKPRVGHEKRFLEKLLRLSLNEPTLVNSIIGNAQEYLRKSNCILL